MTSWKERGKQIRRVIWKQKEKGNEKDEEEKRREETRMEEKRREEKRGEEKRREDMFRNDITFFPLCRGGKVAVN